MAFIAFGAAVQLLLKKATKYNFAAAVAVPASDTLYKVKGYTGKVIWKAATTILGDPKCEPYTFAYTAAGDVFIGGDCDRFQSAEKDSWICKVDNLGHIYDPSPVKPNLWVPRNPGLVVAPNPCKAGSEVHYSLASNPKRSFKIEVISSDGRLVFSQTGQEQEGEIKLPLNLPEGLYLVRARGYAARLVVGH